MLLALAHKEALLDAALLLALQDESPSPKKSVGVKPWLILVTVLSLSGRRVELRDT